eukprot:10041695-Alexandrium_andersonii.AAC.1
MDTACCQTPAQRFRPAGFGQLSSHKDKAKKQREGWGGFGRGARGVAPAVPGTGVAKNDAETATRTRK